MPTGQPHESEWIGNESGRHPRYGSFLYKNYGLAEQKRLIFQEADFFDGDSSKLAGFKHYHVFNAEEVIGYNPDHPDLFSYELSNDNISEFI